MRCVKVGQMIAQGTLVKDYRNGNALIRSGGTLVFGLLI